jgi:YfiH family protein
MELELIKDKVYYKIFDRTYTASSGIYSKHKHKDAAKLAKIQQNIDNIKTECKAKELVILKQVHGNSVICADTTDCEQQLEADGSVTKRKNIALSVLTADCVPVLFASADGQVIGAAHCGWKSAKSDLIKQVSLMMKSKNATNIKAIIGPSIQQKSYEVSADYYHDFVSDEAACKHLFIASSRENHYMFDLIGYVKHKLEQENIELFLHIDDHTYSMPEKYPSYRRSVHSEEAYTHNILSTIMIK